jgi:hypothetical protein
MSAKLRELIGEDQWKKLNEKYEHLDQLLYVCNCETCGELFFRAKVSVVQEMLKSGEWDIRKPASQLWYIKAARHWIPQKFHSITAHIVASDRDSTKVMDLSADWTKQMDGQRKRIQKGLDFDKAMLNELDYLEGQIKKKT